jgi:hypothetical protein
MTLVGEREVATPIIGSETKWSLRVDLAAAYRLVRPPVELGFHAHRDYLQLRGTPASMADLSSHDLIGYDAETPALRETAVQLAPLDRQSFALRADSNLAQLAAIRARFGVGLCQVRIALRDPALVRVLPEGAPPLPLSIVMHEDLKSSARFQTVFDALAAGLPG